MKILNHSARRTPSPDGDFVSLAMLVQGYAGVQAVYVSIVPDISLKDPTYGKYREWTVDHGRKASYTEAKLYFPGLEETTYDA